MCPTTFHLSWTWIVAITALLVGLHQMDRTKHSFTCHALLMNPTTIPRVKHHSILRAPGRGAVALHIQRITSDEMIATFDDALVPTEIDEQTITSLSRRQFMNVLVAVSATATTTGVLISQPEQSSAAVTTDFATTMASPSSSSSTSTSPAIDWKNIFQKASKKALGGGKAGATAAVVQVCSLMWLRTSMNYQYRYGGNLQSSLRTLYNEGGIPRLYQGLPFALIQGPLTRFGDTAANVGILALLETLPETREWPLPLKTACGSAAAGLWRIVLMPIDASKTALQVEGSDGLTRLWSSAVERGPGVLYRGALAQAAATAVGHFPWFLTYNFLDGQIPIIDSGIENAVLLSLARSAFLGFASSGVSDVCSNSLRVIKTTKQTAQLGSTTNISNNNTTITINGPELASSAAAAAANKELSYADVVKLIIETDGIAGLFGRGLQTRLLTNAIQGAAFSVLWRYFQQVNGV